MADLLDYDAYLDRHARAVGPRELGEYAKHHGMLIKKLSLTEFTVAIAEYRDLAEELARTLADGSTVNNGLLRRFRERAADLLLTPA